VIRDCVINEARIAAIHFKAASEAELLTSNTFFSQNRTEESFTSSSNSLRLLLLRCECLEEHGLLHEAKDVHDCVRSYVHPRVFIDIINTFHIRCPDAGPLISDSILLDRAAVASTATKKMKQFRIERDKMIIMSNVLSGHISRLQTAVNSLEQSFGIGTGILSQTGTSSSDRSRVIYP
jgi:hypothetical protein